MTVAIVIAGGVGSRMGKSIPKQFIQVRGKHVLAYTLEAFQHHPLIDAIEVVCISDWQDVVWEDVKKYSLTKVRWVIPGGNSAQESIRNGVFHLEKFLKGEDMVVIHDGIRPIIDNYVLNDVLEKCAQYGNGVTSMPYNEQIFLLDDEISTVKYIPRETLRRVSTPQAYRFDLLDSKYHEAFEKQIGIYGSSYTNTMMVELGVRLFFAKGSDRNIKLTTPGDLEVFEAMLNNDRMKA